MKPELQPLLETLSAAKHAWRFDDSQENFNAYEDAAKALYDACNTAWGKGWRIVFKGHRYHRDHEWQHNAMRYNVSWAGRFDMAEADAVEVKSA